MVVLSHFIQSFLFLSDLKSLRIFWIEARVNIVFVHGLEIIGDGLEMKLYNFLKKIFMRVVHVANFFLRDGCDNDVREGKGL